MNSLYDVSSRTRLKIIKRMNLSCSACNWNEAVCDLHHIIPKAKGGTDEHANLTCLCPNCHRKMHYKKSVAYKTLDEQIGDSWKNEYAKTNVPRDFRTISRKGVENSIKTRRSNASVRAKLLIDQMKCSGIDFQKYGWVARLSELFNMRHQHITKFLMKHDPEFFSLCYTRANNRLRTPTGL